MIKKKAKSKTAAKTAPKKISKKKGSTIARRETNPTAVRKKVSRMVESKAVALAKAVIGKAEDAELAAVKYLFEVAAIYPPQADQDQATAEEDCLAKTLLHRLNIPDEPIARDEEDEPASVANPAKHTAAGDGEERLDAQHSGQESSDPEVEAASEEKHEVPSKG